MQYRKPNNSKLLLAMLGIGLMMINPVRADSVADDSGAIFKGPASTCVRHSPAIYPCVSLSPPAYHSDLGIVSIGATPDLPLDSGADASESDSHWLARLKNGEVWNPQWRLSRQLRSMNMDFTMNRSGAAVNMNLGVLKFNVNVDDSGLSESRFFLGIDRSW